MQYINIISAENISEVIIMKMRKTPGKFVLGIGLTAAAVAMTPVVRNMIMNKSNQMMSSGTGNNSNNYS